MGIRTVVHFYTLRVSELSNYECKLPLKNIYFNPPLQSEKSS